MKLELYWEVTMTEEQRKLFLEALGNRSIFNDPHKRYLVRLLWEENKKLLEENENLKKA